MLTPEEKNQIIKWLRSTWDYIGNDCFIDSRTGEVDSSREFSRDEVFEVCADQIEMLANLKSQRNLIRKFFEESTEVKQELKERAFPLPVYGY